MATTYAYYTIKKMKKIRMANNLSFDEFQTISDSESRKEFTTKIELWQALQTQPKKLKVIRVNGKHAVYKCGSDACKFAIHSKYAKGLYRIFQEDRVTTTKDGTIIPATCVQHSVTLCNNLGSIQPAIAALVIGQNSDIRPTKGAKVKEQARHLKEHNLNLGGHNRTASEITEAQRKAVFRTTSKVRELEIGKPAEIIKMLRSLVDLFPKVNEGAYSNYENYEDGSFRRCYIIPQLGQILLRAVAVIAKSMQKARGLVPT